MGRNGKKQYLFYGERETMTEQQRYDIAEWLCYNHEAVRAMIKPRLLKWLEAKHKMADKPIFALQYEMAIKDKYKDAVLYVVAEHHPKLDMYDIEDAFKDERVLIILDKYYLGELNENTLY